MRFLVIGLGSMGHRRFRNLRANGVEDTIIGWDTDPAARDKADAYGFLVANDIERLPPSEYDAIICSTPPNLHGDVIRKAVREGKHLLVEHGVSDDGYDDALAARDGRVRVPSCSYRFHPAVQQLKQLLDAGTIGRILTVTHHMGQYLPDWHPWADYRTEYFAQPTTSAIREMFPFEQTWLTWLVDAPLEWVRSGSSHVSDLETNCDDALVASLGYGNAVLGTTLLEVLSRQSVRRVELVGSEGSLMWDSRLPWTTLFRQNAAPRMHAIAEDRPAPGYVNGEQMYIAEIGAWLLAINGEPGWTYSFAEDRAILEATLQPASAVLV